jgi:hypothetical protein
MAMTLLLLRDAQAHQPPDLVVFVRSLARIRHPIYLSSRSADILLITLCNFSRSVISSYYLNWFSLVDFIVENRLPTMR